MAYFSNEAYEFEQEAFSRIFGDSSVGDFTLYQIDSLPERSGWIWSNGDSQQPQQSLVAGAEVLSIQEGSWVKDVNLAGHVFLNQDIELATEAVNYLLGTAENSESEPDTTDTGSTDTGE